jgi:hypothetical protein
MVAVLLGTLSVCCFSLGPWKLNGAPEQIARPDIVTVDWVAIFGELERPSVQFPHDLHTEVMEERNEECTICHPVHDDGRLSLKYERLADGSGQEMLDLYHENCIACHEERASTGAAAGPVACGDCHRRRPGYELARQPFGFDKSLHYRHIKATDEKCDACHHLYDEAAEKLVYVEGEESSCRDCHREEKEEKRSAFEVAAHEACIGCHRDPPPGIQTDDVGPQLCAGCHDQERQLAIEVVENPPRLKRKQPDFVLVSVPESDLAASKWKTVPFSHVMHEEMATSCRVCHHETLEQCSECHSLRGSEKGDGVTYQQAMHGMMSDHSCVGCHEEEKSLVACAGCHALMAQEDLPERACRICHAGPDPESVDRLRSRFESLDDFRPPESAVRLSFAPTEIPETVTIGVLSSEYEQAEMPHRKIVETLSARIKESKIATHFHGHEDVVCKGCHHHSPIGEEPPLCEHCHAAEFDETNALKPGLEAAYHLQCLGCHKVMEIEEPKDCAGCHREKEKTSIGS